MSRFLKVLTILLLILLVEAFFIYKGYVNNKNKGFPMIKDINPYSATHVANGILNNKCLVPPTWHLVLG